MDIKAIVSAKGQVVIPKPIRETMGLHYGSELIIHVRADSVLEFKPVKKKLSDFFGMGAKRIRVHHAKNIPINVDETIAEAVSNNNPTLRKGSSS